MLHANAVSWPLAEPFAVHGHTWFASESVVVTIQDGPATGRGEGTSLFYDPTQSIPKLVAQARGWNGPMTREGLLAAMPATGARNAIDCALWDLEAKRQQRPAWAVAGMAEWQPVPTMWTIGLSTLEEAGEMARRYAAEFPILKVKLGGADDIARIREVRRAAPRARLVIDANAGWTIDKLAQISPILLDCGVEMIEQPLPPDADADLEGFNSPIPLCADESCQTTETLASLVGRYQLINIKLDKVGGLTAAFELADAAEALGFGLMVGNMIGSSLAMAPAFLLAQRCQWADLDGPKGFARDVHPAIAYVDGHVLPPSPVLWG
jgi:L-alanine-DL-glutamate epimerase-like enolase superfamily enzyme